MFVNTKQVALNAALLAKEARLEILKMTSRSGASHVGSALSVVDILSVIYSGSANISPSNFTEQCRDIVILSKGHAAAALYSILSLKNFFPLDYLRGYCQNGAVLGGHVTAEGVPGVELSTGSLGHGLPYGLGIAMSRKINKISGRVFIIMSDGECDEGTTWESALIANHHNLSNVCVIVDRNRIQSLKDTEMTLKLEPFPAKWKSFGWNVVEIDGHNHLQLAKTIMKKYNGPLVVIASTTKGKGVKFMENSILWHYRSPNAQELESAELEVRGLQ